MLPSRFQPGPYHAGGALSIVIRVYPALTQWCVEVTAVPTFAGQYTAANKPRMLARHYADLPERPGIQTLSKIIEEALREADGYAGDLLDGIDPAVRQPGLRSSRPSRPDVGAAHRERRRQRRL